MAEVNTVEEGSLDLKNLLVEPCLFFSPGLTHFSQHISYYTISTSNTALSIKKVGHFLQQPRIPSTNAQQKLKCRKPGEKMERERISKYAYIKIVFPKLAIRKMVSPANKLLCIEMHF